MAFLLKSNFVLDESTYHWGIGLRKEIRRRPSPLVILAFDLFLQDFMCWVYSPNNVYILDFYPTIQVIRITHQIIKYIPWWDNHTAIIFQPIQRFLESYTTSTLHYISIDMEQGNERFNKGYFQSWNSPKLHHNTKLIKSKILDTTIYW